MALSSQIATKIKDKTQDDSYLKQSLLQVLSRMEDGKQAKRAIEEVVNNLPKIKEQ